MLRFGDRDIDWRRVHAGQKIWKTSDPALERELRATFEGDQVRFQRPLTIEVHGHRGVMLTLIATDDRGHSVKVESSMKSEVRDIPREPEEFREQCAARLLTLVEAASRLHAFVGLDGFVDEIIHVVNKRDDAERYHRLPTIEALSERIAKAAGKSTNIELVVQRTKLGGNGPIMANALARLGIKVTYVGALGYPIMHPVFNEFAMRAEVHSIAEPGRTDALELYRGQLFGGRLLAELFDNTQLGETRAVEIA